MTPAKSVVLSALCFLVAVAARPVRAQTFTTLYSFTAASDGNGPFASVFQDPAGRMDAGCRLASLGTPRATCMGPPAGAAPTTPEHCTSSARKASSVCCTVSAKVQMGQIPEAKSCGLPKARYSASPTTVVRFGRTCHEQCGPVWCVRSSVAV
jgi:hypothetical protein